MKKLVALGIGLLFLAVAPYAVAGNDQSAYLSSGTTQIAGHNNDGIIGTGNTQNNYNGDYVADNAFGAEANANANAVGVGVGVGIGFGGGAEVDVDNRNTNMNSNMNYNKAFGGDAEANVTNNNTDVNCNSNFGINSQDQGQFQGQGQEQDQSQGQGQEQGQSQVAVGKVNIEQSFNYEDKREFVNPGTTENTDLPDVRTSEEPGVQEQGTPLFLRFQPEGGYTIAQINKLARGNGPFFNEDFDIEVDSAYPESVPEEERAETVTALYREHPVDGTFMGIVYIRGKDEDATSGKGIALAMQKVWQMGANYAVVVNDGVTEKSQVDGISLGGRVTGGAINADGDRSGIGVGGLGYAKGGSWQTRLPWYAVAIFKK